jgi:hypothetical protein
VDICTDGRERRIHPVTAVEPVATGRGVGVSYANDTHRSVSSNGCATPGPDPAVGSSRAAARHHFWAPMDSLKGATALDDQFGQKTLPL